MPEKFVDIFPPQPSVNFRPKKLPERPAERELERQLKEKPYSRRKAGLILIVGILIIIGVFLYFSLSRAQIEIWPETQTLNFEEKAEVSTRKTQPDFSAKIFPGKIFETEPESSQEFPASSKVLKTERARGIIKIYNVYSDSSQSLVATTRFVSADGKLFRTQKTVVIPAGHYEKGKLVPGNIDIEVVADQPGEDYNIGPSTFSIPGFAGTSKYTAFYGKSFSPMTGGFRGEANQVTQEDLDRAKDALTKKLFEEGIAALKNKIPSDFVLLDNALSQEIIETAPALQAGAEAKTFNFRAKVRLKALAFKKSDLENFAEKFIVSRIPQDETITKEGFWSVKKIQAESLKINYEFSSISWEEGKIALNLKISAKIYPDINEAEFKKALFGKSLEETQLLLRGQPQVKKTEIKLWPFWVEKIPQKEKKIEIKLRVD